ncbi:MAG: hypothetical protein JWO05_2958 [Gemmatimonadetes bacterium]|nr:hypothetical protein [Gemmatimonadota bacterium]
MRISKLYKAELPSMELERVPLTRYLLWGVVGVIAIVGLVLYFMYARRLSPLV